MNQQKKQTVEEKNKDVILKKFMNEVSVHISCKK